MKQLVFRLVIVTCLAISLSACSVQKREPHLAINYQKLVQDPLLPHETKDLVGTTFGNWFFGQGLGHSIVKIGSAIVYPPIAFVWLGDLAASSAGYDFKTPKEVATAYRGVTAIPGHVTAKVSGQKYRDPEAANERILQVVDQHEHPMSFGDV